MNSIKWALVKSLLTYDTSNHIKISELFCFRCTSLFEMVQNCLKTP